MDTKTATLISAIENGTRHMRIDATHNEPPPLDPKKPWKPHCSAMFRETMRQLRSQGVRVPTTYTDENADANELGKRIRESKHDWIEVALREAQGLANQGTLVVGSYVNPDRTKSGHLGFIYPVEVKRSGPLVRDGSIHRNPSTGEVKAASSYGAVPAGRAFPIGSTQWFKYRHY